MCGAAKRVDLAGPGNPARVVTRIVALSLMILLAGGSFALGEDQEHCKYEQCRGKLPHVDVDFGLSSFPGKGEVEFRQGKRSLTILTFGQSQLANVVPSRLTGNEGVFQLNILDGKFYDGDDPLLGTHETRGNVATRLGRLLVKSRRYDTVLLVPVSIGLTSIRQWILYGDLYLRVVRAHELLRAKGLAIDALLWMQGETDKGAMNPDEYIGLFSAMVAELRRHGIQAPIFVARESICKSSADQALLEAQAELPQLLKNVHPGPNLDTLGGRFRTEGCHVNDEGADLLATMWLDSILGVLPGPEGGQRPARLKGR